ncbi:MAG TPA: response regulator [Lachnospiraceae bacterium]|nr:response regulator [Lachnospiraceae bacterium]
MEDKITCCIVDDSNFFRKFMRDIAEEMALTVLGDYHSGDSFLKDLADESILFPELVFLDINMPGHSGTELLEDILDIVPEAVIIMISTVSDVKIVKECLMSGASNFINKNTDKKTIMEIITDTLRNNAML